VLLRGLSQSRKNEKIQEERDGRKKGNKIGQSAEIVVNDELNNDKLERKKDH
jgi:hypothetical protein